MWWTVMKEAATNWSSHKDARQGAALAYYSVFSLGPIIVIAIAVAGLLFGRDAVTSQVMSSIKEMLGDIGAKAVEAMLAGASLPAAGILATIFGIGVLLFAAVGVVVQLKDAIFIPRRPFPCAGSCGDHEHEVARANLGGQVRISAPRTRERPRRQPLARPTAQRHMRGRCAWKAMAALLSLPQRSDNASAAA